MAHVSTYLNFERNTEEVFNFYKSVFGGEFSSDGISRYGEIPATEGAPQLSDEDKNLVMHIELPILGCHSIMGSDMPESMGFKLVKGNNAHIMLQPDSREETERLFNALKEGGAVEMELQDTFWGAYFGNCTDQYGVNWMFNCFAK
jgi:PhnB protein